LPELFRQAGVEGGGHLQAAGGDYTGDFDRFCTILKKTLGTLLKNIS